ncbi:hypothetical protein [Streptomyces sp. YIM S03343]
MTTAFNRVHLVLAKKEIGGTEPLDRGGQAVVHAAPDLTLPDCPGPLVYKEYHRSLPDGFAEPMLAIVALRERLEPRHRRILDERTMWPVRLVTDGSRACGIVMRRIPDPFFQEFRRFNGQIVRRPRDVQHLMTPPEDNEAAGIHPARLGQRGALCRELAVTLGLLHGVGAVYGDLNQRNVLYWSDPGGRCALLLVDCDAVRLTGNVAPLPQLHVPEWAQPEGGAVQSVASDRYKYGLFVLRTLVGRAMGSVSRDPEDLAGVLDPTGLRLLRASLDDRPSARPSLHDWYRYWNAVLS